MNKILVIEDSEDSIEILDKYLSAYECFFARTGKEGLKLFSGKSPDLVILDITLPDMSGFEICNSLKEVSDIPVIILSGKKGSQAHTTAYKLGADNYLEKPFNKSELLAIVENKFKLPKAIKSFGNFKIDPEKLVVSVGDKTLPLTNKEFKTLNYLFDKFDQLVMRQDLLSHVWPKGDVRPRVVDNHVTGLRKKIVEADVVIEGVYGKGYKLIPLKKI